MLNRSLCCHSERSEESLEQFRNRCVRFARVVRAFRPAYRARRKIAEAPHYPCGRMHQSRNRSNVGRYKSRFWIVTRVIDVHQYDLLRSACYCLDCVSEN